MPSVPYRYAPLSNSRPVLDAEREMDDAFESDDDDNESTPLHNFTDPGTVDHVVATANTGQHLAANHLTATNDSIPGSYDFERDYDYPPPGSPPAPSAVAQPNSFGNTNGRLPTSPLRSSFAPKPRTSFFRRTVGAILPSYYVRVPTGEAHTRAVGSGLENDGVFANVAAKPSRQRMVLTDDGDVHLVPETQQKEPPPSYAHAQADAAPPYWDNTVHAPAAQDPDSMIIDDLPSGSLVVFFINCFVSFFFQFVGFFLTYLIHSTHAAKFGSRAGLGLTLIQFGYYSHTAQFQDEISSSEDTQESWMSESSMGGGMVHDEPDVSSAQTIMTATAREWLSFLLMTLGWVLLLSSIAGFWRVKRWEASIRNGTPPTAPPAPLTPEQVEEDRQIRRNINAIFGYAVPEEVEPLRTPDVRRDEYGRVIVIPDQQSLEEARLARDLRAAGLI